MIVKRSTFIFFFFIACIPSSDISSKVQPLLDSNDMRTMDIFDDVNSLEDDLLIDGFLDSISLHDAPIRQIPVKSILGLLEDIGAFSLLDQDFYKQTNPFVKRSLLDLPVWEFHGCQEPEQWIVGFHLFWNHMDRSVFCCKSTNINSYLDLELETLFTALDELTPQIKALFPNASLVDDILNTTNVKQLLGLFENFTVQQRRTGIMLHAWRQWSRIEIRMLLPFYYLERNIFAKPAEQAAIEEQFGALDPDEAENFQKNHAISDKVGIGDFRFECDYAAFFTETFAFRIGGFVTVPTAFAITKGIKGSDFLTNLQQPTFDLQSLFDLIPEDFNIDSITPQDLERAKEIVIGDVCKNRTGFFLGALNRLNAILLETKLGNDQHFGIGFLFRSRALLSSLLDEYEWADRISFNNRLSVEYLAPSTETRFFIRRNQLSDFTSRDFASDNETIQEDNLQFIQEELVNKFYPFAVKTNVQPGLIIHWTSRWCISGTVWDITIGTDFWLQTREKFNSFDCVKPALLSRLDIAAGKNSLAYQFKSFAGFGFKIARPTYLVFIGVNAEGTNWNKGIGDDITATLNIEVNF